MNKNFNKTKKISIIFILALFCISLFSGINISKAQATIYIMSGYANDGSSSTEGITSLHATQTAGRVSAVGEAINITRDGFLYYTTFYLRNYNSPNATLRCAVYTMTGTYGVSGLPQTEIMLSNNTISTSELTSSILPYNFTFGENLSLVAGDKVSVYVYAQNITTLDTTNRIDVSKRTTSSTYNGNAYTWRCLINDLGYWQYYDTSDTVVILYGSTTPVTEEALPTPIPEPTTPTPTPLPQITVVTNIIDFLFGTSTGSLGAGFGLVIWLICCVLGYILSGKTVWGFFAGNTLAFILNVVAGLWGTWTLFLLILIDGILILGRDRI